MLSSPVARDSKLKDEATCRVSLQIFFPDAYGRSARSPAIDYASVFFLVS
jgi:hypothetical protein